MWSCKRALALGVAMAAIAVTGCGSDDNEGNATADDGGAPAAETSGTAASAEGVTIAFPIPGPAPYVDGYFENWDKLAKEAGVETLKTEGDWTPDKQAAQIDALIAKKPDVFVIWAADNKAIVPVLARIKAAGIPAVATNAFPDEKAMEYLEGYTGPDDVLQGKLAAEHMIKAVGTSGEIAMVRGTAGNVGARLPCEGLRRGPRREGPRPEDRGGPERCLE